MDLLKLKSCTKMPNPIPSITKHVKTSQIKIYLNNLNNLMFFYSLIFNK